MVPFVCDMYHHRGQVSTLILAGLPRSFSNNHLTRVLIDSGVFESAESYHVPSRIRQRRHVIGAPLVYCFVSFYTEELAVEARQELWRFPVWDQIAQCQRLVATDFAQPRVHPTVRQGEGFKACHSHNQGKGSLATLLGPHAAAPHARNYPAWNRHGHMGWHGSWSDDDEATS